MRGALVLLLLIINVSCGIRRHRRGSGRRCVRGLRLCIGGRRRVGSVVVSVAGGGDGVLVLVFLVLGGSGVLVRSVACLSRTTIIIIRRRIVLVHLHLYSDFLVFAHGSSPLCQTSFLIVYKWMVSGVLIASRFQEYV